MAVAFTRSNLPGTEEATLFYENKRDPDALSIKEDDNTSAVQGLFPWENRSILRRRVLQIVIGFLGLAIIVVIICTFTIKLSQQQYTYLKKARFKLEDKVIEFRNTAGKFVLSGEIGLNVKSSLTKRHSKNSSKYKFATEDGVWLVLTESRSSILVNWTSTVQKSTVFRDCLFLKGSNWYGGSELIDQKWPLENVSVSMGQYVPQNGKKLQSGSEVATYGSVLERYWLNSNGMAVIVDARTPLHVSINESGDKKLCLKSDPSGYLGSPRSTLVYTILSDINPKTLHLKIVSDYLGYPREIPSQDIIQNPIWAITVKNSNNNSQKDVEGFSSNIRLNKFLCSHVLIRGQYSGISRTFSFDPTRFPSPETMIKDLHSLNCKVSLHIQPHLKIVSSDFFEASKKGVLLQNCAKQSNVPGLIKSEDILMACIDMTSSKSKEWFSRQLENFKQQFNVDAFEFSGGDVSQLPYCFKFQNKSMDVGYYSQNYAQFAASLNGIDTNVGYKSQRLPIFVKMSNKNSDWDGLKALIPTVLSFGIMGYPFVLPSVIGGNSESSPDKELYIRWLQASLFLPALQFAKPPWAFDEETVEITHNLLKLRSSIYPTILEAFNNVTKAGAPIIRPLWWIAPEDKQALVTDSQFMLGDHYLIAPVLEKSQSKKEVYLPVGKWQEMFGEKKIIEITKTGKWKTYDVMMKDLLYFKHLVV